jgi:hypothetical protein
MQTESGTCITFALCRHWLSNKRTRCAAWDGETCRGRTRYSGRSLRFPIETRLQHANASWQFADADCFEEVDTLGVMRLQRDGSSARINQSPASFRWTLNIVWLGIVDNLFAVQIHDDSLFPHRQTKSRPLRVVNARVTDSGHRIEASRPLLLAR